MWIKVHYNPDTFTDPIQNFKILQYLTQRYVLEFFGKVKILKALAGFDS